MIVRSYITEIIVITCLKCQEIVKHLPPYSWFKSYVFWLPAWWALWLLWWPLTDAAMFQCVYGYLQSVFFFLVLFHCCILLEIKLTTTTTIVFQWADDVTHNGLWDREISYSTSSGNTHAPSRLVVLYQSGSLYPVCMTKVCICMMLAPMRYPLVINDICHNLVTRYIEYNWRRLVNKSRRCNIFYIGVASAQCRNMNWHRKTLNIRNTYR